MPRVNRIRRWIVETARENQWFLPLMGASVGVLLALAVGLVQESDDRSGWTVTVAEGRGTLLSWLSILFAGFSIVLAVATLTIQNIVSKFSLRMFRLYERGLRDRFVMALFAGTATFVVTEQVLLRSTDPAAPVPVFGFVVAMAMMVATGVAMIWYVTTVNRYLRVDRLARGITARTVRVVEARSSANCGGRLATSADFERSPQASPIRAGANGFFVQPDPSDLMDVAPSSAARIVVDCLPGAPVVAGQPIGWVAPLGDDGITEHISAAVASAIEVEPSRGIEGAAGYGIVVLVDTAIMALSPAINDPNTAVQVIEEMTFLFQRLSRYRMGSFVFSNDDMEAIVVIRAPTFGEFLTLGTEQILLYGKDDPMVVAALAAMVQSLLGLDVGEADRAELIELSQRTEAIAADLVENAPGRPGVAPATGPSADKVHGS